MATPELALAARMPTLPIAAIGRAFGLLFGIGASVGMCIWSLSAGGVISSYALTNRLPIFERQQLLFTMFGGGGLLVLCGLVVVAARAGEGLRRIEHASLRLSPLVFAGFLTFLFKWQLWIERELTFAVLVSILGFALRASVAASLRAGPLFPGSGLAVLLRRFATRIDARARFLSLPIAVLAALGFAAFFSYQTIVSAPVGSTGTLRAFTSVMTAAAAIPLYLFARRHIGRWLACLVVLFYLLYAPVHRSTLYGFHYLPLAVFLLWLTLWLMDAGHYKIAVPAVLLTLLVRDDLAICLVAIGLILFLISKKPGAGLVLAATGAIYFLVVRMVVMPFFPEGNVSLLHLYQGLPAAGEPGYEGVLKTALANPVFTLTSLLDEKAIIYAAQLGAPLCFFPWRRPIGLLASIPGLFFTLLATGSLPSVQISFQYTAYFMTFLFVALVINLERARRADFPGDGEGLLRQRAWLVAIACLTLVTSHQWGAIFQRDTVKADSKHWAAENPKTEVVRPKK